MEHRTYGRSWSRELDGLKGFAALMVSVSHSFMILKPPVLAGNAYPSVFVLLSDAVYTGIKYVASGKVAVILFFLISGYLMERSLDREKRNRGTVFRFYFKRFVRLYPLFLFVLGITLAYVSFGYRHIGYGEATPWFNYWFRSPVTYHEILDNVLQRTSTLNGVGWSLNVELKAIVLFPLLFLLSKRIPKYGNLIITGLLYLLAVFNVRPYFLQYLYIFQWGIVLHQWEDIFTPLPGARLPSYVRFCILYGIPVVAVNSIAAPIGDMIAVFFLWMLLGGIVYPANGRPALLNGPLVQTVGAVSYAFYLLNFLVIYAFGRLMLGSGIHTRIGNNLGVHGLVFLASLAVTILLAKSAHKFVEKPLLGLGNRILAASARLFV